ncbi:hypothetical protein Tco_1203819 [Tanacetum coccineum]
MSTYLKHMGGYIYKQLKGKRFDEIQKLFDKEMKRVNTSVAMGSEVQESKEKKVEGSEQTAKGSRQKMLRRKRARKEQQQESSKKQRTEEDKDSDEFDELHKEGMLVHYQLIRADGSFKRYSSTIRMLQGIDREDLEALWKIVKTKYGDIRLEDEFEKCSAKAYGKAAKREVIVWYFKRTSSRFLEVTTAQVHNGNYAKCAAGERITTV